MIWSSWIESSIHMKIVLKRIFCETIVLNRILYMIIVLKRIFCDMIVLKRILCELIIQKGILNEMIVLNIILNKMIPWMESSGRWSSRRNYSMRCSPEMKSSERGSSRRNSSMNDRRKGILFEMIVKGIPKKKLYVRGYSSRSL